MRESRVQSPGQEDPLEEELATDCSILAWKKIPIDGGAWWATVHGVMKSWTQLKQLSTYSNMKLKLKKKNWMALKLVATWLGPLDCKRMVSWYGQRWPFCSNDLSKWVLSFRRTEGSLMLQDQVPPPREACGPQGAMIQPPSAEEKNFKWPWAPKLHPPSLYPCYLAPALPRGKVHMRTHTVL